MKVSLMHAKCAASELGCKGPTATVAYTARSRGLADLERACLHDYTG